MSRSHSRFHTVLNKALTPLGVALACSGLPAGASAQSLTEDVTSMISEGTSHLALRYRFEQVEQDNALRDATASTLRTRLSFQSAPARGFSLALEADSISTLGSDRYDSFALDRYRGRYSVIADPVGTEINVASVRYKPNADSQYSLGRQRLNHANQRFLGSVGFRQNEQTMDSFSYHRQSGSLTLDYSYLWNVNRIFGGDHTSMQVTDFDSNSHALLLGSKQDWGTLSGFAYALDFDNARTASSLSYGLSYQGKVKAISLLASVALQQDYGDNPLSYDAAYWLLEGSGQLGGLNWLLGAESLGSDDGATAFSTPLATLHRYQGFADMFLGTPAAGLEDYYLTLGTSREQWSLSFTAHDFHASEGSQDYGTEWDVVASYRINGNFNLEAKFASYDRDHFGVDTNKLWLTLNVIF